MKSKTHFKSLVLGIAVLLAMSGIAISQEEEKPRTESADTTATLPPLTDILEEVVILEELVVIGSRAQPRSVAESAVPIDVVTGEDFVKQGDTDVQNLLRDMVPSYNVNTNPISDASTVVRPPSMRGLAPDHTLVLINGKRRHRAAVIHWITNGVADGAQGPDIAPIPSIAIKRVEVLRDGASAQYGSDAIAGVLNFELKDNYKGGSFEVKPGIFQEGDGLAYAFAGNIGLGTPDAWANFSVEYGNEDETDRSVQRDDAARLIRVGNNYVENPAQIWGQPYIRDDLKFFVNYGININDNVKLYGHGNYASKEVEGGFYFRNPNTRGGVFRGPVVMSDGTTYYDPGKAAELGIVDGVNGHLVATLLTGNLRQVLEPSEDTGLRIPQEFIVAISCSEPDAAALQRVFDDPDWFTFQELFPGGFTPRFGAFMDDRAFLAGIRGSQGLMTWDLSASYGRNEADYFIFNTVNSSLGPDQPWPNGPQVDPSHEDAPYFDPGTYIQTDTNFNFDITYPFSEQFFFAAGLEYRTENFEIVQGQRESWVKGPLAEYGFTVASNGFSGFGEIAAGTWSRSNWAVYGDAEFTPQEDWLLGAALRFENFDDFGSTTNFKLATNYGLNENTKVRGSFSTGFRAPTPGQQNAFNVSTIFDPTIGDLTNDGTIPSNNPVAESKGGEALDSEKSTNISAGIVFEIPVFPVDTGIPPVNITVDYFHILVKGRLTLSQNFSLTPAEVDELLQAGITAANFITNFKFFVNDFDTKTQGIDVVLTAPVWCDGLLSLAYNLTNTEVTEHNLETLGAQRIRELQEGLPKHRGNLTVVKPLNDMLEVLGRLRYYSSWYDQEDDFVYGDEWVLDAEVSYTIAEHSTVTVGGQNILDIYPDINPSATSGSGHLYSQYSPFGFSGAFWYAKYHFSF